MVFHWLELFLNIFLETNDAIIVVDKFNKTCTHLSPNLSTCRVIILKFASFRCIHSKNIPGL